MRYDVFISYPRISDFFKQWVSAFARDLEDKLREKKTAVAQKSFSTPAKLASVR
jgi:hypothetical protein